MRNFRRFAVKSSLVAVGHEHSSRVQSNKKCLEIRDSAKPAGNICHLNFKFPPVLSTRGLPQDHVIHDHGLHSFPAPHDDWVFFLTPGFVWLAVLNYLYLLIFQLMWNSCKYEGFVCFE